MKSHLGWRARIGLIYPARGMVMEPECYAMAPEGVSIHTDRLRLTTMTVDGLAGMMGSDEMERCAATLARGRPDVILFGGTSATFLKGIGYDVEVKARLARVAGGIPVTTTSTAMLNALRALRVERVSFVSPYDEELTRLGRRFLEENGIAVAAAAGLGMHSDVEMWGVSLEQLCAYVKRVTPRAADGVFIPCTGLRSVGALAALERELGIPVVSAVQASFWDALRLAGVPGGKPGFGRLFDC